MNTRLPIRDVILDLAGVAGLLMKSWARRCLEELGLRLFECSRLFLSGECGFQFAVYFLASIAARTRLNHVAIAVLALGVVEGFEFTNGFGMMTNVYDPLDYLANALGVALAYVVDVVSTGSSQRIA